MAFLDTIAGTLTISRPWWVVTEILISWRGADEIAGNAAALDPGQFFGAPWYAIIKTIVDNLAH
jgi:hypothetical protein